MSEHLTEMQRQIDRLTRDVERLRRVEKPSRFLPFNTYIAVPAGGTSSIALASATRMFTYLSWTQAVHVATTNNGSNYWQVYLSDGVINIGVFDTSTYAANTWYAPHMTSLVQPATVPLSGFIAVGAVKVGAPGNLYWGAPAVCVL